MDTTNREAGDPRSPLGALADGRRRRLLVILEDRGGQIDEAMLARDLAARERGCAPDDVPETAVTTHRLDLDHVHLPALAAADLVDRDRRAETLQTTDHPAFDDPAFPAVVEVDAPGWDAVLSALADARRRTVLAVLRRGSDPMVLEDVVRAVADRVTATGVARSLESLRSSLHHVHLPALDDAGLVGYDADAGTVAYRGHSELDEAWLDVAPGDPPRPILPAARRADDVWRLAGRSQINARGRSLCEAADEELFVMVTAPGHLEEACVDGIRDAVDRGVDVYVGSQVAAVRDRLRREVPGATRLTLQRDWLDPVEGSATVGRLVMADRSAVMVATRGVRPDPGGRAETALTATGDDNALVLLLSELLGSRLDQVGAQDEDPAPGIPL